MVMALSTIRHLATAAAALGVLTACSSSSLSGSAATKTTSPTQNNTSDKSTDATDTGSKAATDSGDSGKNNSTDDGSGKCKADTTPNSYNIMFIFDNTGSQRETDPTNVRRSGALSFLDQFSNYVGKFPASQVYMGVLSFNTQSIHSVNGWMLLNGISSSVIKQEIVTATTNPNGLTAYSPVLQDAANYFGQVNALPTAQGGRNYVVFLTDGDPNADTTSAINDSVANLVNKYDVAMIALATGPQVSDAGQALVKSLALPTTATKFPDHVGRYYRAPDAATLDKVWSGLFGNLGGCS